MKTHLDSIDYFRPEVFFHPWECLALASDLWLAVQGGAAAIAGRAEARLGQLVRYARLHSPLYRSRYQDIPSEAIALAQLPPVTKHELMTHFNDWVTDGALTRHGVEAFTSDLGLIGQPYLGRYAVWTTSGTTGEPGLFVKDPDALLVYDALQWVRRKREAFAAPFLPRLAGVDGRFTMVGATGGHFAGCASVERLRRINPWLAATARVFSILQPLDELVAALDDFQPSYVATYPTTALLLAQEKSRGKLRIHPTEVWTGGEYLSAAMRAAISEAFACPVLDEYGASEFMDIAYDCGHGWLHVNADWVLLEPVDKGYRPVPPGTPSQTVLLTNLANRVQPIIRYDLGDSVILKPDPCACGSCLPAIRVQGRTDDIIELRGKDGRGVRLLPLALTTVIEEQAHVHRFQLIGIPPATLAVRLELPNQANDPALRQRLTRSLRDYLAGQGLANVRRDPSPPATEGRSGKLRCVCRGKR